jgi:hypothetical protein
MKSYHILRIFYEYQAKGRRTGMAVDAVEKSDVHIYV